jgi:superfamily I DNA/RNA helicase
MPKLAFAKEVFMDVNKVEKSVARKIMEIFDEFEVATHTGLHLEKIKNARNPQYRSIRVDQSWRGIVLAPDKGDVYTLLRVLPHDDAYQWAERSNVSVNAATGGFEIRDEVAIEESLPELQETAKSTQELLFAGVGDADLKRLGIDEQTLEFARAFTSFDQLEAAKGLLPETQWDVLFGLAAGYSPEEVWSDMGAVILDEPFDTSDIDSAILRSRDRIVIIDGHEELEKAFAYPFDTWRIYLHPSQRGIVDASFPGSARVTGGPGTGKTVVALHRAHALAQRNDGKVLLTTFTVTLAEALQAGLDMIVEDDDVENRIEVIHVDRLIERVFHKTHRGAKRLSAKDEASLWAEVIDQVGVPLGPAVLASEWSDVVLGLRATSLKEYLAAKKDGKGRGLTPNQAAEAWKALDAFERALNKRELWTRKTVRREAAKVLEQTDKKPYRHIVVDEAQDLAADHWRLLRAAAPEGLDDIFIAGDTHQRIYDNHVTLGDVGIDIGGRSSQLNLNYRTTAEILRWSLSILRGEPIDDMDGGLDSIARCRSAAHGPEPHMAGFDTSADEAGFVAEAVTDWIDQGTEPSEIGIATRTKWFGGMIQDFLRKADIPTVGLGDPPTAEGGVSIGTMHRMKGLEFRCVVVAGVGAKMVPEPNAITPPGVDQHAHDQDIEREKCLLFVAATRAREELLVTWHGQPSAFLDPVPTPWKQE